MVNFWVNRIIRGKATLADVPEDLRDAVREELIKRGWIIDEQ